MATTTNAYDILLPSLVLALIIAMRLPTPNYLPASFYSEGGSFSVAVTTPRSVCAFPTTTMGANQDTMSQDDVKVMIDQLLQKMPEPERVLLLQSQLARYGMRGQPTTQIAATKLTKHRAEFRARKRCCQKGTSQKRQTSLFQLPTERYGRCCLATLHLGRRAGTG